MTPGGNEIVSQGLRVTWSSGLSPQKKTHWLLSGTNTSTVEWLCSGAPAPGMDLTMTVLKPCASAIGGCRERSSATPRPTTLKLDTPWGIILPPKALGSVGFNSEKRAIRLSISSREICLLAICPPFAGLAAGLRWHAGTVNLQNLGDNCRGRHRFQAYCQAVFSLSFVRPAGPLAG